MKFDLGESGRVNVTPSGHWPTPIVDERDLQQAIAALQEGGHAPLVRHYIGGGVT